MRVFICSPYRAETPEGLAKNIANARFYARLACMQGHSVVVPHLLYTQFLDDEDEEQRILGINLGIKDLEACDILWAYCKDYDSASPGMRKEILHAISYGIPVEFKIK